MMSDPATLHARAANADTGSLSQLSSFVERARWWPFLLASLISVLMSGLAPEGRRAFDFDFNVSLASLQFSLGKEPHIGAAALLAALAVGAAGRSRWLLAWALTVLVGLGWELGQTTVIGHTARLADLVPDAVGAAFGCLWGVCMLWLLKAGSDDLR